MMGDDPPFLAVGTEVSAKYKGAFCEAKIRKVVKSVKCKVLFKDSIGMAVVGDESVKGPLRVGSNVEARHPDKKEYFEGTIMKIQDCSQYTVVFDDGDITTLRRTALCLKSGRHFAESETLDQLPLTHPEHFSNPVIGGRRGGRRNPRSGNAESSDEEELLTHRSKTIKEEKEADTGRVVCVEGEKKKQKDNWFPALVVAPTAQDTVRIHVKEEYLVRSFKDGRYYTVPKKEITPFSREIGSKVDNHTLKTAVEKALLYLDKDELPPHWDRELLFGLNNTIAVDSDNMDSDTSDDEPREEKDHFVAQLYKFMDDRGTPINQGPTVSSKDVDLYRLFKIVQNLGGYNRVTNYNHWKTVSSKLGFGESSNNINMVKNIYKKFLHSFEEFYRKLGCTMVSHPRTYRGKFARSLIRDKDRLSTSKSRPSDESEDSSQPEPPQPSSSVEVKVEIKSQIESNEELMNENTSDHDEELVTEVKEKVKRIAEIKEEPKEESKLESVKELKREKSVRQSKLKVAVQPESAPPKPNFKSVPKTEAVSPPEKKRSFFKKLTGKRNRDNKPAAINKTAGTTSGLAVTRKKRVMKERVKCLVDKIKSKLVKEPVVPDKPVVVEQPEKPIVAKPRLREETVSPTVAKVKKEEIVPVVKPVEERKKCGRKKKEKNEPEESFDTLPTYKTVCVGDKLKVYYGPTHESKVTYEAKVLSIKTEGSETTYLVHYTGWNNRYDEYIKHSRIADNLSWVPGRSTKKPNAASLKTGRRKTSGGGLIKAETKGNSPVGSNNSKSSNFKTTPPAVKRSSSRMSLRKEEQSETELGDSGTDKEKTPNDMTKETNSQKRRRKMSDSESENRETADNSEDSLIDEGKNDGDQEETSSRKNDNESDAGSYPSSPPPPEESSTRKRSYSVSTDELPVVKKRITEKKADIPCEKVEEIEFEDSPVSKESVSNRNTCEEVDGLKCDIDSLENVSESVAVISPEKEVTEAIEEAEPAEEDIYEFKEPEPFEFEARKSLEDKIKGQRRPIGRIFEDIGGPVSQMKRQQRTILPGIFYKGKKEIETNADGKEPTESVYNFDACEEMFDKLCSSPLRATSEEPNRSYQLFSDLPEGDQEENESTNDGSTNSKTDLSPSQMADPVSSYQTDSILDSSNFDSNGFESTEKSCFSRDDDDDDNSGDNSINDAIQRAIKQDISDDDEPIESISVDEVASSPGLIKLENIIYSPSKESSIDKTFSESISINVTTQEEENEGDSVESEIMNDEKTEESTTIIESEECQESIIEQLNLKNIKDGDIDNTDDVVCHFDIDPKENVEKTSEITSVENDSEEERKDLVIEEPPTVVVVEPAGVIPVEELVEIGKGTSEEDDRVEISMDFDEEEKEDKETMDEIMERNTFDSPCGDKKEKYIEESEETMIEVTSETVLSEDDKELPGGTDGSNDSVQDVNLMCEETIPGSPRGSETGSISKCNEIELKNSPSAPRNESPPIRASPMKICDGDMDLCDSTSSKKITLSSSANRMLSSERSPKQSKYNFLVKLDPDMDPNERISLILGAIHDIRKCYAEVKAELAVIDKRRKKLRKRERENMANARVH